MHHILPFTKITKQDASTAGGKGASLGEMTQVGIPVPPGFVILASALNTSTRSMCSINPEMRKDSMHTKRHMM